MPDQLNMLVGLIVNCTLCKIQLDFLYFSSCAETNDIFIQLRMLA